MIQLTKNLVVFDIESTGVHFVNDRIVELFMLKIDPQGKETEYLQRFNPGIPIPPSATEIHQITNEMVAHEPLFGDKASEVLQFIGDADLAGFNSNKFDIPMLIEELGRCNLDLNIEKRKLIDAQRIFHTMEPRNLAAAYRFYCKKELDNAHTAEADTRATWEIIQAQAQQYPSLGNTVSDLHKASGNNQTLDLSGRVGLNSNKEPIFNFGKHKHKTLKEVFTKEPAYYDWLMQADFSSQTKKIFTRVRLQMKQSHF